MSPLLHSNEIKLIKPSSAIVNFSINVPSGQTPLNELPPLPPAAAVATPMVENHYLIKRIKVKVRVFHILYYIAADITHFNNGYVNAAIN